jgi:hypothetical protein
MPEHSQSMDGVAAVVADARRKGVTFWTERGALHYRAPRGALSQEDKGKLDALSGQITAFLKRSDPRFVTIPALGRRHATDRVPLTGSQLEHWHKNCLGHQPTRRSVASATRICGKLDSAVLQSSVEEIVQRHEALRTRIVVAAGSPVQLISDAVAYEFASDDLSAMSPPAREMTVERLMHELILQPVYVHTGPLFAIRLVKLDDDEHVFITVMEHSISDAWSRSILLRDIFGAYGRLARREVPFLPPIPVQFPDYAVWLGRLSDNPQWLQRQSRYWQERLRDCTALQLPRDGYAPAAPRSAWARVPVRIDFDLKRRLETWCRSRRTTLAMAGFTAFAALSLRWSGASDAVISYQSDGRFVPLVNETIGYFATLLNLRIELAQADTASSFLGRVTDEYCSAYDHVGFKLVRAQSPPPAFAGNPAFNWVPQAVIGAGSPPDPTPGIALSPYPFSYPMPTDFDADHEPSMLLFEHREEVAGSVSFPLSRFTVDSMQAFCDDFLTYLRAFVSDPGLRLNDVALAARLSGSATIDS